MSTTIIKNSVEYTSYDTSSADVAATLPAVIGKEYEVINGGSGGYTLTITYGSNTMDLADGQSGRLTYDGTDWSTQFSFGGTDLIGDLTGNVTGDLTGDSTGTHTGDLQFYEDRIFSQVKNVVTPTLAANTPTWVEIASVETTVTQPFSGDFVIGAFDGNVEEIMTVHASGVVSLSSTKHMTCEIKSHDYWASAQIHVLGARIAYGALVIGGGAKIEVLLNTPTAGEMRLLVGLNNNMANASDASTYRSVWDIYDAPVVSTGYTPDESTTATYLTAGAVLPLESSTTFNFPIIGLYPISTSVCRVSAFWPEIPFPGASDIDITFPSSSLVVVGGGTGITLSEADISISNFTINGRFIQFYITDTTNTPFTATNYIFGFRIAGSGCELVLS